MTAALLWIALPGFAGVLIGAGRTRYGWSPLAGIAVAAGLAALGLFLTVDASFPLGPIELFVRSEQVVLGRSLVIGTALLRIVAAAYGALALWGIGGWLLGANRYFIPSGLMATALLTAALAVRPWQFAGVFLLLGVLVLVPMLIPPGAGPPSGALKFIAFHALGVPFLVMAGTLMEGLESIPAGLPLTLRPAIFLGLSFILLLGVFPFHGWIPGLVDDYEPLPVAFVLVLLPGFIGVLGLQLIDRYAFLRNSDEFFTLLRAVGILTVGAGSALVIVQRRLGRILGFAALIETGLLLLAIGSGPQNGPVLYFPLTAARSAGFLVWGGGLAAARKMGIGFDRLRLRSGKPGQILASLAVLAGLFSTAGFPLLPGFPVKYRLAAILAGIDPTAVFAVWLGMTATAAAGLRTLAAMLAVSGPETVVEPAAADPDESRQDAEAQTPDPAAGLPVLLLAAAFLLLLVFGLLPGWISWLARVMAPAFERLVR